MSQLVCSACYAFRSQIVPMERDDRKWKSRYTIMGDPKIRKLRFSVCSFCDTLMNLNRWEKADREFAVQIRHLEKKALGEG